MHKTGHAFTYLLLKESVANDVINVSLFACDEILIDLLRRSTPDFIVPDMTLWPTISPDLNPVDYSIRSVMQQHVYHSRVKDIDALDKHLIFGGCKLDQSVVNHTIDEWRHRLSACVNAYHCYCQNNNVEMATL